MMRNLQSRSFSFPINFEQQEPGTGSECIMMSNIVNIVPRVRRRYRSDRDQLAGLARAGARAAAIGQMPLQTKTDMQQAIFLLGLSNAYVRQFISNISDSEVRARLIAQSERVEALVEIARQEAAAL
jgi:hypothetical protein